MTGTITISTDARGVALLTLARPDKHNALDAATMDAVTAAAGRLGADRTVRAVVLAAEGDSFCAGGDLDWMRAQATAEAGARMVEARRLAGMLAALNDLPKLLVARVQGNAFGGGVGLIAVCDIAIGVTGARFALTETRLGLIPATIAPYVIARIGAAALRRHALSARTFGPDAAVAMGLLARSVAPDALDGAVADEVAALLTCAPGAVADTKALVARLAQPVTPAMVEASIAALAARWADPEAAEGVDAFFARRRPGWSA